MVTILIMSAKVATLGFLKYRNDIIVSVHDVTNKILLRESNYIVDVVM